MNLETNCLTLIMILSVYIIYHRNEVEISKTDNQFKILQTIKYPEFRNMSSLHF